MLWTIIYRHSYPFVDANGEWSRPSARTDSVAENLIKINFSSLARNAFRTLHLAGDAERVLLAVCADCVNVVGRGLSHFARLVVPDNQLSSISFNWDES